MEKESVDRNQRILQLRREGKSIRQIGKEVDLSGPRVHKILKRMLPRPESMERLTKKEQNFVLAVIEGKTPTNAVLESHDVNSRESAKALQKTLLKKDDIKLAISEYLQIYGLTKGYRVKKLKSHVDNRDPIISLRALDQSWRLDSYPASNVNIVSVNITPVDLSRYLNKGPKTETAAEEVIDITPTKNEDEEKHKED
jgi:hypothetical protein